MKTIVSSLKRENVPPVKSNCVDKYVWDLIKFNSLQVLLYSRILPDFTPTSMLVCAPPTSHSQLLAPSPSLEHSKWCITGKVLAYSVDDYGVIGAYSLQSLACSNFVMLCRWRNIQGGDLSRRSIHLRRRWLCSRSTKVWWSPELCRWIWWRRLWYITLHYYLLTYLNTVFTARRSYASAVLEVVNLSVCPSVCLSVSPSVWHTRALWQN